jgi:hypothetical protein
MLPLGQYMYNDIYHWKLNDISLPGIKLYAPQDIVNIIYTFKNGSIQKKVAKNHPFMVQIFNIWTMIKKKTMYVIHQIEHFLILSLNSSTYKQQMEEAKAQNRKMSKFLSSISLGSLVFHQIFTKQILQVIQ